MEILHANKRDWQIFIRDYIIFASISWFHTVYNDFRHNILSPALADAIDKFPDGMSHVFGGACNVGELKSSFHIHNQILWNSVHQSMLFHFSGLHYETSISIQVRSL